MRWSALLPPAVWLVRPALAVFADDAYQVDYHIPLVGIPLQHSTFFHQPHAQSKASLLYTLSDRSVLGAVNPRDGAAIWRQQLRAAANSSGGFLRAGDEQDVVVSAVDGNVAAWTAADGRLVWSRGLGDAVVKDLEILEMQGATASNGGKDALLLHGTGPAVLERVDGDTGAVKWAYVDKSGDSAFQVSASATDVYLISLHHTMLGGVKINVVSVDPVTGQKGSQYSLASDGDVTDPSQILHVGANSASPLIAWTDKARKNVKVNILGTKAITSLPVDVGAGDEVKQVSLHAPRRSNALAHFLIHVETASHHAADVYHVDLKALSISKAYSLPKLAGKGAFSCSSVDGNVFFTRITDSEMILVSSQSHGVLARHTLASSLGDQRLEQAQPLHVAAEVAMASSSSYPTRAAVLLSSGEWVLLRNGDTLWSRPEYLSQAVAATFAELSEEQAFVQELETESHQNAVAAFIHRLTRHISDLQRLPALLQDLTNALLGKSTVAAGDASNKIGLQKVVVLALTDRRVVALDTASSGKIKWITAIHGPSSPWEIREVRSTVPGVVEVVGSIVRSPYLVELQTGKILEEADLSGIADTPGVPKGSYRIQVTTHDVRGYDPNLNAVWQYSVPADQRIVAFSSRPPVDPVALIGRALGDRRVLYKYLNPNLAFVASSSDAGGLLSVALLDTISGKALYTAAHQGVDSSRPIASTMSENWFAYSFTLDDSAAAGSRGQQIVINELYESTIPNDRGPLGSSSNYSSISGSGRESAVPHVVSLSFHVPEEIVQMAVTQTRQGITSRDLLVDLADSKGIVAIPRQVLDARRPVGRDPTKDEQAEGLMRYTPILEFDPKWYLNHQRDILGVKSIITSPSGLESTSLVFAYGLDIFGTRVSPSFAFDILGKGFNKVQMTFTVAALAAAVVLVGPFVQRKQINQRWQIS